jgi:glycosyltransferase involved in cell wall biosynthesis
VISYNQLLVSRELGGAGMIALELASAMRNQGYSSSAWLPGKGAAAQRAREIAIPYHLYAPETALVGSRIAWAMCNYRIARLLRSQSPGIVHLHSPLYYGALSMGLRFSGLKTVVHVHLEEERSGLEWAFRRSPNAVITCARFLMNNVRSAIPEHRQNEIKFFAVPNAVDTDRFRPGNKIAAKLRVGISLERPMVLMVANLAAHKGHETALRAAAILKEKQVAVHFWFAGAERGDTLAFTTRLKSLVHELGLSDNVRFLGQRNDIADLLQAADVFLLPSTSEGLPLSILEAQASKVPVLAAPTAAIPEIISHGRTGFLVAANDPAAYAIHLNCLLQNPRLYASIAEESYSMILKEHTWNTYVNRICDIYASLLRD